MLWLDRPVPLAAGQSRWFPDAGARPTGAAVLVASLAGVQREADACAVLMAPARSRVLRNGARLGGGLHLLRHADQLSLGEHVLWVAVEATPEETTYDPTTHGADLRCPRLRVLLHPGDSIVICAGAPARPCGLLYDARAWHAGVACECGFDPKAASWTPPVAADPGKGKKRLDELVATLVHRRG